MKQGSVQILRGMRDILPAEMGKWHLIEGVCRDLFERYGYREIRTPILEATELFSKSIGEATDIVGKEMFTFQDQKGRSISLRPENTASVVRAVIEHSLLQDSPVEKLYYIGPMFRYERPTLGRQRQFHQIGVEVLGSDNPAIDAEVIEMGFRFLEALGVTGNVLLVNSIGCRECRPVYRAALKDFLVRRIADFCEDCKRRYETNPLRILDCKNPSCQALLQGTPEILDSLCDECRDHFARFRLHLDGYGIGYRINPRLVRGLDYYTKTAFEILNDRLGAQDSLLGGGRYDGLSEDLGGPPMQAFGFALGMERLTISLPPEAEKSVRKRPDYFLVYRGEEAFKKVLEIARRLREKGYFTDFDFRGGSLKSQLRVANRKEARYTVILGEDELQRSVVQLRDMDRGEQTEVSWDALGEKRGD